MKPFGLLRLSADVYVDPEEVAGLRADRGGTAVLLRSGGEMWVREQHPTAVADRVVDAVAEVSAQRDERGSAGDLVSSVAIVVGLAIAAAFVGIDLLGYLEAFVDWGVNLIESIGGNAPEPPARH